MSFGVWGFTGFAEYRTQHLRLKVFGVAGLGFGA